MIKRDILQRVIVTPISDGQGGGTPEYDYKEKIPAHVSVTATMSDITQFGITNELMLHTATNYKLDDVTPNVRYMYSGRLFEMLHQIKSGNEYFQTFKEVTN